MKPIALITLAFFLTLSAGYSQESREEDPKVQIFTHEEKANLQIWFNEERKRMQLSEEQESEYNSILGYYIAKISRLDDKDQDLTEAEFKAKLNEYLSRQEAEMKEMLTPQQFTIHQEIYGEFLRSAYRRWGIEI